jgi:tRNA dimethylallyltransferase
MRFTEEKPPVVVVCGPTGIGKTAVAIALAGEFNAEIISADSMQIYRRMDIGTAKPTAVERQAVAHHLIDIRDPDEDFDAAAFVQAARTAADQIIARRKLPFVVGGTGLYIKAFLEGLFDSTSVDPQVRARLQQEAAEGGAAALHQRLAAVDPETAARLHPNDTFRIVRALETFEAAGEPISALHAAHGFKDRPYEALKIGLHLERRTLYRRIDRRVDAMLAAGLEREVRGLLAAGYSAGLKSMQAIGYRHMVDYIQGRMDREECLRTFKRDTRRYAKRQLTWFGADDAVRWHVPEDLEGMRQRVAAFLNAADNPENQPTTERSAT